MKKIFFLLLVSALASGSFCQIPVVYFDFISHDEDTGPWANTTYYTGDRTKLINLATYFQTKGITFNMQSDHLYLRNVISKETALLMASTNNKNILRWMHEDKGVEFDPHSHEKVYIYPDIVKLMDSLGLPESKVMGGSLYSQKNGINCWMNLINGQNGVVFPNKFWQPDYLMGGGSPNHVADLNYYGFWNPKDTDNYLTHFPANHPRHMGTGCSIKVWDTSNVAVITNQLKDVIQKVQSGQYPSNGFYFQTIFFGHGDLNNTAFYNKLIQVADSANAIVATGKAQWKTFKQAYQLWEAAGAQMFQWECGQLASGTENIQNNKNIGIFPNPFAGKITVQRATGNENYELINAVGQTIWSGKEIGLQNFTSLPEGLYFVKITDENSVHTLKLVKE